MSDPRRLRILTWHVHGNYLWYLTQVPHEFFIVTDAARSVHHTGRSGSLPWGANVHDVALHEVADGDFDVVLYQSRAEYVNEPPSRLFEGVRRLPRVMYLEHDPPLHSPTDERHWADREDVVVVHVTGFNALMWEHRHARVEIIEHGVQLLRPAVYEGRERRGVVVVNNIDTRGRRLGADVYRELAAQVPLTLVGMGSARMGGHGEVRNDELPGFIARYRFLLNPIRYTSLGLSVIEAMMVGLPIIGLATTEMSTVLVNGVNGWIDTRPSRLVEPMRRLLDDPGLARRWGQAAQREAKRRFGIERFIADWDRLLCDVVGQRADGSTSTSARSQQ